MFFFFDDDHPYSSPTAESLGVYKIKSLKDYMNAKEQLKKLKQLYEKMGQEKQEEDDESMAVAEAILEQEKNIDDFVNSINVFDSKYLSNNIEQLLKQRGMKVSDLETLINVSAGYISRTMGADSKKRISIDIVWMIASLFNVNIDDLLNRDLTLPTKDLKKVVAFIKKLKDETDQEIIHWRTLGNKPGKQTDFFFRNDKDGKPEFAPNGEDDGFYSVNNIYSVNINIGPIYLVELESIFDEKSYRIYLFNDEEYNNSLGSGYEIQPLSIMINSEDDTSDLLVSEFDKLRNAIKTHEKDFVVTEQTRNLMEQYLNPAAFMGPEELPF